MSSEVQIVLTAVDKASTVLSSAGQQTSKLSSNLIAVAKAAGVATLAYKGLEVLKTTVTDTVAYAEKVRDLSRALGINAEESSKLLQIADDLKIEQQQLTVAFRYAINKGVDPSIDGLKKLATEYQTIQDPIAKAQFAMENFGTRGGLEMQKVLELTGEELDAMAQSAVDAGLVLSNDAVQAAREYEIAMDNMSDAAEGLKTKIGVELIPPLTAFINLANEMINLDADTWFEDGADAAAKFINKVIYGKDTVESFNVEMGSFKDEIWLGVDATNALAEATDEASDAEGNYTSVMGLAEDALKKFNVGASTKLQLLEDIALATGKTTKEEIALKDAVDFLTRMLADGKITQEEYLALVQQLAVDGTLAAEIVKGLGNAILLLPDSKDIHINVKYHKYGPEPGPDVPVIVPDEPYVPGPNPPKKKDQFGGPVFPGSNYLVGERGPELFVPSTAGSIVNNWNLTINEAGSRGNVVMDFEIMKALARA